VLAGLSQPIPRISFETLRAAPEATRACIERLSSLGSYRFNVLPGESTDFVLPEWAEAQALVAWLDDGPAHADVHARLTDVL
jgi:hypothetical protein